MNKAEREKKLGGPYCALEMADGRSMPVFGSNGRRNRSLARRLEKIMHSKVGYY